jgi:hypothetical protein
MFLPDQLATIVTLTSEHLLGLHKDPTTSGDIKDPTTPGEILKLFGVLILITRYEFSFLWSNTAPTKYQPAPSFGRTGMARHRFDSIWAAICFSRQPDVRPQHLSSEAYRWLLVDGFVDAFNSYRETNFFPSDLMDRDRRYFITSASSLQPGRAYSRTCWQQVSEVQNAEPERVNLQIPQPEAAELYYSACGMIDRHNRCRQDDLQLEKKLGTLDWPMRVNTTLLGMCIVDTWYVYSQCTKTKEKQQDFYSFLAEELIDNKYDSIGPRSGRRNRTQDAQEARN